MHFGPLLRLGIPISGMSCSGSGESNPCGGRDTHMSWGSIAACISLAAFLGLGAHTLHMAGHVATA